MRRERARCNVCFAGKPLHRLRFVEAAIVTALLMMSIGPVAVANAQAAPAPAGQSSATPASATDIVGIWQGTVHIPQEAAIHSPGRVTVYPSTAQTVNRPTGNNHLINTCGAAEVITDELATFPNWRQSTRNQSFEHQISPQGRVIVRYA